MQSTHTADSTNTYMKLTMRRMVDMLLCPPPRDRSPSFINWEPKGHNSVHFVTESVTLCWTAGTPNTTTRGHYCTQAGFAGGVCIRADLPASLVSLSSPTPLSPRSPAPTPPSLSRSLSPCRREHVRFLRRRAGGVLAASAPTASPVVTTVTSVCRSVSSLHTSLSAWEI